MHATTPPEPLLPPALQSDASGDEIHVDEHVDALSALHVLDLEPVEVARQLTLLDEALWKSIRPWELLQGAWTRDGDKHTAAPNVRAMIARFNAASRWIQTEILREETLETRVAVVRFALRLMRAFMELRNYNGAQQISAAFSASAIYRLKKTLLHLTEKEREELESTQRFLGSLGNNKALREALRNAHALGAPTVPCASSCSFRLLPFSRRFVRAEVALTGISACT